jgi:hypothetical protein
MIREFKFPAKDELIQQVKMMLNVDYNESKFNFLIDLVLEYRKLGVSKKPSQNQIADLIQELYFIGTQAIGRKTAYEMKYRAFLWKMSQEEADQKQLKNMLERRFSKNTNQYVGSML